MLNGRAHAISAQNTNDQMQYDFWQRKIQKIIILNGFRKLARFWSILSASIENPSKPYDLDYPKLNCIWKTVCPTSMLIQMQFL